MALVTSNLPVSSILQVLGVSSAKAIFYNGSTLMTLTEFGAVVNKYGLNASYCPGSTVDDRLQNLLNDRKLSYFKGYDHNYYPSPGGSLSATPNSLGFLANGNYINTNQVTVSATEYGWSMTSKPDWVTVSPTSGGTGNTVLTISVSANSGGARNGMIILYQSTSGRTMAITIQQEGA